jgi:YgiT-type zinc finger domain-containing protein
MELELKNCHRCGGLLERKCIDHDVGPLLGLPSVVVHDFPAPVCGSCGAVVVDGAVIDSLSLLIAANMLAQPQLDGLEVRYLRKQVGDTQEQFAARIGTTRASVARWESEQQLLDGTNAYSVRSHVYFRLKDKAPFMAQLEPCFVNPQKAPAPAHGRDRVLDYSSILRSLTGGPLDLACVG